MYLGDIEINIDRTFVVIIVDVTHYKELLRAAAKSSFSEWPCDLDGGGGEGPAI